MTGDDYRNEIISTSMDFLSKLPPDGGYELVREAVDTLKTNILNLFGLNQVNARCEFLLREAILRGFTPAEQEAYINALAYIDELKRGTDAT